MKRKGLFFVLLTGLFIFSFLRQEQAAESQSPVLQPVLPAVVQKAALGYLKQIGSEIEYIVFTVFLGGVDSKKNVSPFQYAENLAYNFDTITDIHPTFLDFYYLCQSSLSYISPEYAVRAAEILLKGEKHNPEEVLLPSWAAFDYFYYANENQKAAEIYLRLAQGDIAPRWFGHLAAVLKARDGNLQAGLNALQLMLKTATEETDKKRYRRDIKIFKKALTVADSVKMFERKYGYLPHTLENLVPEFLAELPGTGDLFRLSWDGKVVSLVRPDKANRRKKEQKPLIFIK